MQKAEERVTVTMILLASALAFLVLGAAVCNRAEAQTWHSTNQITIAWDAVTQTVEGNPIPPAEVSYDLFVSNAITDPDKSNPSQIAEDVLPTQYTVTLNVEGKFFIGVRAARTVEGERESESTICWSDNGECTPVPFGLRRYAPPAGVTGLRVQ